MLDYEDDEDEEDLYPARSQRATEEKALALPLARRLPRRSPRPPAGPEQGARRTGTPDRSSRCGGSQENQAEAGKKAPRQQGGRRRANAIRLVARWRKGCRPEGPAYSIRIGPHRCPLCGTCSAAGSDPGESLKPLGHEPNVVAGRRRIEQKLPDDPSAMRSFLPVGLGFPTSQVAARHEACLVEPDVLGQMKRTVPRT